MHIWHKITTVATYLCLLCYLSLLSPLLTFSSPFVLECNHRLRFPKQQGAVYLLLARQLQKFRLLTREKRYSLIERIVKRFESRGTEGIEFLVLLFPQPLQSCSLRLTDRGEMQVLLFVHRLRGSHHRFRILRILRLLALLSFRQLHKQWFISRSLGS